MTALTQPLQALELANTVRSHNHVRKQEIRNLPQREAFLVVADIVDSPHGPVGAMHIDQLLEAITRIGSDSACRLLLRAGVYMHTRRIRELTPRQRAAVAAALREKAEVGK